MPVEVSQNWDSKIDINLDSPSTAVCADIEMAIADELQNFKEHGLPQLARSTDHWIAS